MRVKKLIRKFLKWKKEQPGISVHTIKFYKSRFKKFDDCLGNKEWGSIKRRKVLKFLQKVGKGMSSSTRHHNIMAIEQLQNFALGQDYEKRKILKKTKKPPVGQRKRVPTESEVDRLLENATLSFRLIYAAIYQSGSRPGELCKMNISNVDFDRRLVVLKKHKTAEATQQPREIPIGDKFETILRIAIGDRAEGPVFRTEHNCRWRSEYLGAMHRKLRDAAGLPEELVPYSQRHGFATRAIKKGIGIMPLAGMMGHKDIQTTQKYVHQDVSKLGSQQDQTN